MKFVISITVKKTEGKKTRTTTLNIHGAEIDPALTVGEMQEGLEATEKFLSRASGSEVSIDIARSE